MKRLLIGLILICSIGVVTLADDVTDKITEVQGKLNKMREMVGKVKLYDDKDLIYCFVVIEQITKTESLIQKMANTYEDGRFFDEDTKKSTYKNLMAISGQMDMILADIEKKASE